MGPNPLTSLVEAPGADAAPVVLSRGNGIWSSQAARFDDEVRGLAAALSGYGLGQGVCAAVLGSEGSATLGAGLAVMAAGGTLVPLDPALSDDSVRRALASSGAVHAIASDERQLSRVLALRPDLSALELVLLMSATPSERKPPAMLVETAIEVGRASLASDPDQLLRAVAESEGGTTCLLVDVAGETRPVSRKSLLGLAEVISRSLELEPGMTVLVALPVGGVERLSASLAAVSRGATLLLADPTERPDAGLDQYPADAAVVDVTGLERLFRAWVEDIDAKSWLGRGVTRWALKQGREAHPQRWKHRLADRLALRGLRDKLGGRTAAIDVIAREGRTVSAEVGSFFQAVGVSLRHLSAGPGDVLAR